MEWRSASERALAWVAALALLAGCGGDRGPRVTAGPPPGRIIAMAPSVAETLHVLDLGDRVVGVGDYVTWPPEWAGKPRLGGLFNPQFERIASLHPDLAVLLPSEEVLSQRLEELGVEVLTVPNETVGDVELAIQSIAKRCGVAEAGDIFLRSWRQQMAPDPLSAPLRVALVIGREPHKLGEIVVAGPDTFFDQLVSRIGAVNAFADAGATYPQVSAEEIIRREPDALVELQPLRVPQTRVDALLADWKGLATLPAVRAQCLYVLGGEHVLVPGPRLPNLMRELRATLVPCARALSQRP